METYNQSYEQNQPFGQSAFNTSLEVDQSVKISLAEAAKWAKFMGIIGMVVIALFILFGIAIITLAGAMLKDVMEAQGTQFSPVISGISLFIVALLYLYPTVTLLKFGSQTRAAIKNNNQVLFNRGLKNLMSCFKFLGIVTLIVIVLYVLAILAIAAGAGIGAMN